MKFHYWKILLLFLFVSLIIWMISSVKPSTIELSIDPLTQARSQNRQIMKHLNEAQNILRNGQIATNSDIPNWAQNTKELIEAAIGVTEDQSLSLDMIAEGKPGMDINTTGSSLASIVAILGTLSTILLSWRKDMRDARKEIERLHTKGI